MPARLPDKPTLAPPHEQPYQSFITNKWQVTDVLRQMLDYTGTADVTATSLSTCADFLSVLHTLKKKGKVRQVHLVLDHQATTKTKTLLPMLEKVATTVRFCAIHAKVIICKGENATLSLITSQNQTRGCRTECYLVTADPVIAENNLHALDDLKTFGLPCFQEVKN